MRIAEEIGLSDQVRNDLYYALLLKDCGCSGNASKIFHALGSDDIKAKRDVKTTDWTRLSWETLQYALSHVAPGKPFLERTRALFRMALNGKQHTKDVVKIRCERGATLARLMKLRGLTEEQLPLEARILVVADIFDALSAKRPYRDSLPLETVFQIMRRGAPHALNAACVDVLAQSGIGCDQTFVDLQNLHSQLTSYGAGRL